jgi:hypothetical protein
MYGNNPPTVGGAVSLSSSRDVCYRAGRYPHPGVMSPFTPFGQFEHGGQSILSMKLAACVGNSVSVTNTLRVPWQKCFSNCEASW